MIWRWVLILLFLTGCRGYDGAVYLEVRWEPGMQPGTFNLYEVGLGGYDSTGDYRFGLAWGERYEINPGPAVVRWWSAAGGNLEALVRIEGGLEGEFLPTGLDELQRNGGDGMDRVYEFYFGARYLSVRDYLEEVPSW